MRMLRYQSLNSYNAATAMPTAVLNDISTAPDAGSRNTYLPGADRANEGGQVVHGFRPQRGLTC